MEGIYVGNCLNLSIQFAALEASSSIDDELAMLKAAAQPNTPALTGTETADVQDSTTAEASDSDFEAVDAELEALRAQMKNI